jgi:hypothetical protein
MASIAEGGLLHELKVPEVEAWILEPVLHNPKACGLPGKKRIADYNTRKVFLKSISDAMAKAEKKQGHHVNVAALRRIYAKAAFIEYALYATAPSLQDYKDIYLEYYVNDAWEKCYKWIMETKKKQAEAPAGAAASAEPAEPAEPAAKRQRFETADERLECCVCKDAERSVVLRPCWHAALCAGCAERCSKCPVCNVTIRKKHPIFLS